MSKYGLYCTYAQLKTELCRLSITSDSGDGNLDSDSFLFSQMLVGISKENIYVDPLVYNYNFSGMYEAFQLTTENWVPINYETNSNGVVSLLNTLNADFTMDEFVCSDSSFEVENISSGLNSLNFQWMLSDGQVSNDADPVFDLSAPGIYTLSLIVTDESTNCSDSKEVTFEVAACQQHSMTIFEEDSTLTSIEHAELSAKLFPNPNTGEFSIAIEGLSSIQENVTIVIYDSYGKLVFLRSNITNGVTYINLDELANGIYHWRVIDPSSEKSIGGNVVISN